MADIKEKVNTYSNRLLGLLGTFAGATAVHYGLEGYGHVGEIPKPLDLAAFYGSWAGFHLFVLSPIAEKGIGGFVDELRGKIAGKTAWNPYLKAAVAGLGLTLAAGTHQGRTAAVDLAERFATDAKYIVSGAPEQPEPPRDPEASPLEQSIQQYVDNLRQQGLARERGLEDYAIFAKDLNSKEVLVDINSDRQQMVASVNKMFVMLAYFDQVDKEIIEYSDEKTVERMIRVSDNDATNKIIDRVGEARVNEIVGSYGFENTTVKRIPKGGRTLDNVSTAADLSRLLEGIHEGWYPRSQEMRRILSLDSTSSHRDRLVDATCIPTDPEQLKDAGGYVSDVMDKTGFIYGVNADAGIVIGQFYNNAASMTTEVPYVVTLLIEDQHAKEDEFRGDEKTWGRAKTETLRSISEAIFWNRQDTYSDIKHKCGDHKGVHPQ